MPQDGGDDEVPRRARRRLVTDALEQEQLGAGDLARQRDRVPGWEDGTQQRPRSPLAEYKDCRRCLQPCGVR